MKSKGRRAKSQAEASPPPTELIPIGRLYARGVSAVGVPLARELIREGWLSDQIQIWQRSLRVYDESPKSEWQRATSETLIELEQTGVGLGHLIDEDDGVYRKDRTRVSYFVHHDEPTRMFPDAANKPETPERHAGGRPRTYDHENILIEAAAYIVENNLPRTLEDLVGPICEYLDSEGRAADSGHVRKILRPLFKRIEKALDRR